MWNLNLEQIKSAAGNLQQVVKEGVKEFRSELREGVAQVNNMRFRPELAGSEKHNINVNMAS